MHDIIGIEKDGVFMLKNHIAFNIYYSDDESVVFLYFFMFHFHLLALPCQYKWSHTRWFCAIRSKCHFLLFSLIHSFEWSWTDWLGWQFWILGRIAYSVAANHSEIRFNFDAFLNGVFSNCSNAKERFHPINWWWGKGYERSQRGSGLEIDTDRSFDASQESVNLILMYRDRNPFHHSDVGD